jgi:transcriptional regulator with XRE-family HTH domain
LLRILGVKQGHGVRSQWAVTRRPVAATAALYTDDDCRQDNWLCHTTIVTATVGLYRRQLMATLSGQVGNRIRELREAAGWSQEQLAAAAKLSRDAISRIERGDRAPRLDTLEEIAAAFDMQLVQLLDLHLRPERAGAQQRRMATLKRHLASVDDGLADRIVTAVVVLCRPSPAKRRRKG